MSPKDKNLLKEETLSFEEIYSAHFQGIFTFMSARLSQTEIARDCAQEVFLRFIKTNPSSSTIKKSIISYLYGIANNVVANYFSGSLSLKSEIIEDLTAVPDLQEEPDINVYSLEKNLRKLKSVDRKILIRHFWLGEGHKEIASKLNMTHDQVRQRYHRALRKLKKWMDFPSVSQSSPEEGRNK